MEAIIVKYVNDPGIVPVVEILSKITDSGKCKFSFCGTIHSLRLDNVNTKCVVTKSDISADYMKHFGYIFSVDDRHNYNYIMNFTENLRKDYKNSHNDIQMIILSDK